MRARNPSVAKSQLVRDLTNSGVAIVTSALQIGATGTWGADLAFNTTDDAYPGSYPECIMVAWAQSARTLHSRAAWVERPTEESETYLAIVQLLEAAEQELYPAKQVSFEVTGIAGITVMHITAD